MATVFLMQAGAGDYRRFNVASGFCHGGWSREVQFAVGGLVLNGEKGRVVP